MPCDQSHLLSPYLDGELPAAKAVMVRDHLAACAECAAEAEGLRAVGQLMGMARRSNIGEPSAQVMDRLRLHVQGLIETSDYGLLRIARLFTGLAASVLIAGIWLLNHHQPATRVIGPTPRNDIAIVSPADFAPKPDPGIEIASAEPATPDDVLERLMGMPEVNNGSLEVELP